MIKTRLEYQKETGFSLDTINQIASCYGDLKDYLNWLENEIEKNDTHRTYRI